MPAVQPVCRNYDMSVCKEGMQQNPRISGGGSRSLYALQRPGYFFDLKDIEMEVEGE